MSQRWERQHAMRLHKLLRVAAEPSVRNTIALQHLKAPKDRVTTSQCTYSDSPSVPNERHYPVVSERSKY